MLQMFLSDCQIEFKSLVLNKKWLVNIANEKKTGAFSRTMPSPNLSPGFAPSNLLVSKVEVPPEKHLLSYERCKINLLFTDMTVKGGINTSP